ncbi:restriction modification system DNA specificity domain protein [Bacteroides sp. CAG:661]|nr:restriction modification system DNA specificity domain protein [Bacteroides sp. CAG:661]
MEEWKEYRLGDVIEFKTGKLNSNAAISKGKYPFFTCSPEVLSINEYAFDQKAILLAGNNAEGNFNIKYYEGKFNAYQRTYVINPTTENVDIKYLYYCLGLSLKSLKSISQGTSTKFLTATIINNLPIKLPSIRSQKQIISILSSLDNKIELNRRINENLEQQAQALFKSWFVDFEPFKDGKFVDSELGRIPEGWKVGTFKDIIHSTLSGDWGKECKQGNHIQKVFCIRGADIPNIKRGDKGNMPTRFIIEKNFQSKALMDGDMVIEVSGGSPTQATGRACRISCGLLDKYNHSIVCTNFCRAIKPLSQYSSFLYYMWEMFYNQGIMFSYENGTTGIKNLDINRLIQKEPIIIPPVEIALEFEKITQIYYEKIQSNGVESEKLSQLRDTLLPRLMSGELAITDVDNRSIFQ